MTKKCKGPCLKHCYNDSLDGFTLILIAIVILLLIYSLVRFKSLTEDKK